MANTLGKLPISICVHTRVFRKRTQNAKHATALRCGGLYIQPPTAEAYKEKNTHRESPCQQIYSISGCRVFCVRGALLPPRSALEAVCCYGSCVLLWQLCAALAAKNKIKKARTAQTHSAQESKHTLHTNMSVQKQRGPESARPDICRNCKDISVCRKHISA